jgi:hypothetical protein
MASCSLDATAMQRPATRLIVTALDVVVANAADPKTPKLLVRRWTAVPLDVQGERIVLDEIKPEIEFTSSPLLLRIDGPRPVHLYDCYSTVDGDTLTVCPRHSDDPKLPAARPTEFV